MASDSFPNLFQNNICQDICNTAVIFLVALFFFKQYKRTGDGVISIWGGDRVNSDGGGVTKVEVLIVA